MSENLPSQPGHRETSRTALDQPRAKASLELHDPARASAIAGALERIPALVRQAS